MDIYEHACAISICLSILLTAVSAQILPPDPVYVPDCEVNKIQVFKGWTTSSVSVNYTAVTMAQCAAHISRESRFQTHVPLAIYNPASFACNILTSIPNQNIILQDSDDENEMVLWNDSDCGQLYHVAKEYVDTDLPGYDDCSHSFTTKEECMVLCTVICPAQGFAYNYDNTYNGDCFCKTITKQQYTAEHGNLLVGTKESWSYYEMLC